MANLPEAHKIQNSLRERRFGTAWLTFSLALAVHVFDEATHDFLSTYNASVHAIRDRLPFLPLPTFTFPVWLTGLTAAILLLLCLSPFAFRGAFWLRVASRPLALIVGIFNATLHIASSIYFQRLMPGVDSAPLLFLAAIFLLNASRATRPARVCA